MFTSDMYRDVAERQAAGLEPRAIVAELETRHSGYTREELAALVGSVPTPALRHRYRWLNASLAALLVLGALTKVTGAIAFSRAGGPVGLAVVIGPLSCVVNLVMLVQVLRWRRDGYTLVATLAMLSLIQHAMLPAGAVPGEVRVLAFWIDFGFAVVLVIMASMLAGRLYPNLNRRGEWVGRL